MGAIFMLDIISPARIIILLWGKDSIYPTGFFQLDGIVNTSHARVPVVTGYEGVYDIAFQFNSSFGFDLIKF